LSRLFLVFKSFKGMTYTFTAKKKTNKKKKTKNELTVAYPVYSLLSKGTQQMCGIVSLH